MSRSRHLVALLAVAIPTRALARPQPSPSSSPSSSPAAAAADPPPTIDARLEALEADVEDVQDENQDLRSQVKDLEERLLASKPPVSLGALNPQITAFLNGVGRFDDKPVFTPDGARIDDRLFMRTLEVEFRAAVDPFADAVAMISLENLPTGGFEADLEEGYAVIKRLPIYARSLQYLAQDFAG